MMTVVSLPGADAQTPEDGVADAPPQPPKPQHVCATLVNKEGIVSIFSIMNALVYFRNGNQ